MYLAWSLPFDTWLVRVFWLHIGLAATAAHPICAKKHRLAMYQKAVTMFYLRKNAMHSKTTLMSNLLLLFTQITHKTP